MTSRQLVADARRTIEVVSPDVLVHELATRHDLVLIDVREEDEITLHGSIRGSVWAPRGMIEFWADPLSPDHRDEFARDRRLVLYCANGNRSALAAETLARLGYRNVAQLDGGLRAWRRAGHPVELP